ncbi:MAG: hypothetical protein IBX68_06345 [Dehalococcoidia bacterium]|nr:hypothetical protein [Dehalococcoidia bacterium]
MSMRVHIYLSADKAVQVLLEGSARGAVSFPDYRSFVGFIQGCVRLIDRQSGHQAHPVDIPRPFLDAFKDTGNHL